MSKVGRNPSVERAQRNQWAGEVNLAAQKIALGMKTLAAITTKDGKMPGGLGSMAMSSASEAADVLKTMLEQRFDVKMTKANLGTLQSAQRTLERASSLFRKVEQRVDDARVPPGAKQFPDAYYGDVDSAAKKMTAAADKSGEAQYYNFNGTNLIARPGQKPGDAVKDWSDAMGAVKSPMGNLAYSVESRITDEVTRRELDTLAKQPPRPMDQVLGDLQAKVEQGNYSHDFMAGLCELQHPAEILAFTKHFMANPPKKDSSQSTGEARDTTQNNINFWVNQRGGAARGTEQAWNDSLSKAMEAYPLTLDPIPGSHIDSVCDQMAAKAQQSGRNVQYTFNDAELLAKPGDSAEQVKAPFNKMRTEAREREAQRATEAAAQRAQRLEDFTAQGGQIIDKAPADMDFDDRGLVPPGGFFNKSDRPLQLITEAQLDALPEGTKLASIGGDEAVKGLDYIDNDTRGGFLAFGFLQ